MSYFVTGATGFIGRFLVGNLLARGEPIYVLVRRGSQKKLDALRERHGATDRQIVAIAGDLAKPRLGITESPGVILKRSAAKTGLRRLIASSSSTCRPARPSGSSGHHSTS